MTTIELKLALDYLGWSQAKLARRLGLNPNTVGRWSEVPVVVERYLDLAVRVKKLWDGLNEG